MLQQLIKYFISEQSIKSNFPCGARNILKPCVFISLVSIFSPPLHTVQRFLPVGALNIYVNDPKQLQKLPVKIFTDDVFLSTSIDYIPEHT